MFLVGYVNSGGNNRLLRRQSKGSFLQPGGLEPLQDGADRTAHRL